MKMPNTVQCCRIITHPVFMSLGRGSKPPLPVPIYFNARDYASLGGLAPSHESVVRWVSLKWRAA